MYQIEEITLLDKDKKQVINLKVIIEEDVIYFDLYQALLHKDLKSITSLSDSNLSGNLGMRSA